jgi:VanZ family protein
MSSSRFLAVKAWAPVVVWAGVIFGLSSIPGTAIPDVPWRFTDKLVHTALYGTLGLLVGRALAATTARPRPVLVLLACAITTAYGITDELHQLFTPHRSCDFYDGVADAVGGLLGGLVAAVLFARSKPSRNSSTKAANQP